MKLPRFTLRDLFWLVLVVAVVPGCKSKQAVQPATPTPAIRPTAKVIDEAGALAVVKKYLVEKTGKEPAADYSVRRAEEGFRVKVEYGGVDENGEIIRVPGGHAVYTVSPQGEIVDIFHGA
jgi:hypothetical protein